MSSSPPSTPPQQATVQTVLVVSKKSVGVAILLTFFFGPLGMLYSTILGAVVMFVVNLLAFFLTAGLGLIITWPIGIIWSVLAVRAKNNDAVRAASGA